MNKKGQICYAIVGCGRAAQLHLDALLRFNDIPICLKLVCEKSIEKRSSFQAKYNFLDSTSDYNALLEDKEIDVIDICTPPYLHEDMVRKALQAGKHVICEKPLSGYFGEDDDLAPIGDTVSKEKMYKKLLESLESLGNVVKNSGKKFMYAENFIYAPSIQKSAEIIRKKKSKILYAKGEESLKGSSSPVAGEWAKTGGGTFIRTGSHPLSAILWLKQQEAIARQEDIHVVSVLADMGRATKNLTPYDHRHIAANPIDVEDSGSVILTFNDGTKAIIIATDNLLGGSKNYVELYCNDATIKTNLTMSNVMETYFLDEDRLDDVYISEMLPKKTGWNYPFLEDEIIRGYVYEMHDFLECVYKDKNPISNFDLAYDTTKIIYAAYLSAELGRRIDL